MAAKKKTKNKRTKPKKTVAKKTGLVGRTVRKAFATKKAAPKKRLKKRPVSQKAAGKTRTLAKKAAGAKTDAAVAKRPRRVRQSQNTGPFATQQVRPLSPGQSGDLQGLSNIEAADSESVDELLEEGNAFEADAVSGVERADDADEKEVRTHEVPEDDVPGEYLDKE